MTPQNLPLLHEFTDSVATLKVYQRPDGRRHIRVVQHGDVNSIAPREWDTIYSLDLIQTVIRVKGSLWTCDEIMQEEDPGYVQLDLENP